MTDRRQRQRVAVLTRLGSVTIHLAVQDKQA
jgi:hypothetical protein